MPVVLVTRCFPNLRETGDTIPSAVTIAMLLVPVCLLLSEVPAHAQAKGGRPSAEVRTAKEQAATAIYSQGVITVSGVEGKKQTASPTSATGVVVISGSESKICPARPLSASKGTDGKECRWSTGTVAVLIQEFSAVAHYGEGSTSASIARDLALALNVTGSPVVATVSESTLDVISKANGFRANYNLSVTACASFALCRGGSQISDFHAAISGPKLTGGTDGTAGSTLYDTGTVQIAIHGYDAASVRWDENSTAEKLAYAIQSTVDSNINLSGILSASLDGRSIIVKSKQPGPIGDGAITIRYIHSKAHFSSPSFAISSTGMRRTPALPVTPGQR